MKAAALIALSCVACSADLGAFDAGLLGPTDSAFIERRCGAPGEIAAYGADREGCAVQRGSIFIQGFIEGLPDLSRLSALREVGQNLSVSLCFDLVSLHGLERLERAGSFGIDEAPQLRDLRALVSLRTVTNGVVLAALESLVDLRGLDGVEFIGAELWLDDLEKLESLDGLGGLRTVGSLSSHRQRLAPQPGWPDATSARRQPARDQAQRSVAPFGDRRVVVTDRSRG